MSEDPYQLLGIDLEASEKQITTAYRKVSIKLHPDKNPDDPNAADKFHQLNQAYQKLLDPIQRLSIDQEIRKKKERELRFAQYDNKRKHLIDELQRSEEAAKKKVKNDVIEKRKRQEEADRIKEEGRKMREQAQAEAEAALAPKPEPESETVSDKLDTTVRIKYTLASYPSLSTKVALSDHLKSNRFTSFDENTIVLRTAPAKGKKNKASANPIMNATALVSFNSVSDAFTIVCAAGNERRGLKDIQVSWAGNEPAVVASLKNRTTTSTTKEKSDDQPKFSFSSTQSSIPGLDFESATLMRLRQAERDRLEREIREQEALEE